MEREPLLENIDQEYVEATAEAFSLGRRFPIDRHGSSQSGPTLLFRLQNQDSRTESAAVPADEHVQY